MPILQSQLTDSNGVVNLSSATGAYFVYKNRYSTDQPLTGAAQIISGGTDGVVEYNWTATDNTNNGVYRANWRVIFPTGKQMSFPNDGYLIYEIGENL